MSESGRIGFVSYAGGLVLAELLGENRWRVTVAGQNRPQMERTFAELYADAYAGPQDGHYGQRILNDLAERLRGVAVYEGPTAPPGVIF